MKWILSICLLLSSIAYSKEELLIFGGENHKEFLGCLNCSKYNNESICNKYGDHGSEYSDKSIWNEYGDFGSQYSDYSPFNNYADKPPIVVDREGGYYGSISANKFADDRINKGIFNKIFEYSNETAREILCSDN